MVNYNCTQNCSHNILQIVLENNTYSYNTAVIVDYTILREKKALIKNVGTTQQLVVTLSPNHYSRAATART